MPKISVLLPVKNAGKYIEECVNSIISQSFDDFEILVMDDMSNDSTPLILEKYNDSRIKITRGKGFINNLNKGIRMASGQYIARMDADDIMMADRLLLQAAVLDTHNDVAVCASHFRLFSDDYPIDPSMLNNQTVSGILERSLESMLLGNIVCHPSVMMRKSFLECKHVRYQHYKYAEDYKLWFEIAKQGGKFYVIPQELLYYRLSKDQVTQNHGSEMTNQANLIRTEILSHLIKTRKVDTLCNLRSLYKNMICLVNERRMDLDSVMNFFFNIYYYN